MLARLARQREWSQLASLAFHDPQKIDSATKPPPPVRPGGKWWGGAHA